MSFLGESPSPWRTRPTMTVALVEGVKPLPVPWVIHDAKSMLVATVADLDEVQPNAFLLAGAPELFEALTDAFDFMGGLPEEIRGTADAQRVLHRARDALHKAREG